MAIAVEGVGVGFENQELDQLGFQEINEESKSTVENPPNDCDYSADSLANQEVIAPGELEAFYGDFLGDVQQLAMNYIDEFFSDKEMYCGGKIGKDVLHSPGYITMILNTNICDGVEDAYAMLGACDEIDCESELGSVATDVRLVVSVLQQCSDRGIPKDFASGMLLMYLELCEGIESI